MSTFQQSSVEEAMHPGVLSCPPETPLTTVARMMATYGVHAIVVTGLDPEGDSDDRPWGIVSGLDVVRAAALASEGATAGGVASTEVVTVPPTESLRRAAQLMTEHELTHVIVVDEAQRPLGVVSTRDVATALAG
jgi:CBS domain-containing protein